MSAGIGEINIGNIDVVGAVKDSIKEDMGKLGSKAVQVMKSPKAQIGFATSGALLVAGMVAAIVLSHGVALPIILGILAAGAFTTAGSGFVMNRNEQRKIETLNTVATTPDQISAKGKEDRDAEKRSLRLDETAADAKRDLATAMDDFIGSTDISTEKTEVQGPSNRKRFAMLGLGAMATVALGVAAYLNRDALQSSAEYVYDQVSPMASKAFSAVMNVPEAAKALWNAANFSISVPPAFRG